MNNAVKIISGAIAGASLTFGAGALSADQQLTDAQSDKQAILKMYVEAQARLNEVPTLDLSTASAEEMTTAYSEIATEQDALDPKQPNLFEALHDKAVQEGTACR